jgi:hypothetical protein
MMILTLISRYASRLVRNLKKQKIYSAVNIVGLAVGLACTLLILLWVQYERSYDGFHSRGGEIYRIINHQSRNGIERDMSGAPPLLGPAIKAQYPEIADYTRLFGYQPVCRAEGDNAPELPTPSSSTKRPPGPCSALRIPWGGRSWSRVRTPWP